MNTAALVALGLLAASAPAGASVEDTDTDAETSSETSSDATPESPAPATPDEPGDAEAPVEAESPEGPEAAVLAPETLTDVALEVLGVTAAAAAATAVASSVVVFGAVTAVGFDPRLEVVSVVAGLVALLTAVAIAPAGVLVAATMLDVGWTRGLSAALVATGGGFIGTVLGTASGTFLGLLLAPSLGLGLYEAINGPPPNAAEPDVAAFMVTIGAPLGAFVLGGLFAGAGAAVGYGAGYGVDIATE